jgi:hypothetical protein
MRDNVPTPGIDIFWEQADADGSCEHPLERELCHRIEALERYRLMILDAEASGRDEMVDALLAQHHRQARLVSDLREALRDRHRSE